VDATLQFVIADVGLDKPLECQPSLTHSTAILFDVTPNAAGLVLNVVNSDLTVPLDR